MRLRNRSFFHRIFRGISGFIKFRILHVDDTPHRIALGAAVGIWIAFTPFLGFHMLMALAIAAILRANKALAVLCVWLSNPLTLLPMYVPAYLTGRFFVGWFHSSMLTDSTKVVDLLVHLYSLNNMLSSLHSMEFWRELATVFGKIGLEVTVGGAVLGTIASVAGYFAIRRTIENYRKKSGRRRFRTIQ